MMQFGTREAIEMYEVIRDSVCVIDHFTDYINHCQDPALRQVLENQQRHMVEEYQRKISVMQGHGLDVSNLPGIQTGAGQQGTAAAGVQGSANIQFGMQQTGHGQTAMGQPTSRIISDRTIAQGALLLHKCGSVKATNAALESVEPHLRNLLANSARTCMDMAYEIFRYMVQKGLYQLPEKPAHFINHMAQGQGQGAQQYQGQPQNVTGMQQNYPGMQQQNYPGVQQQNFQTGQQGGIPRQFS